MALVPYGNDREVSEQIQGSFDIVFSSIKRWWKGEISGKRCAKNVIDATLLYVSSWAGGAGLGALIGMVGGPVGAAVGSAVGGAAGLVGGWAAGKVTQGPIQRFTCKIFDLPKTEALDKAYEFFGLRHNATNAEIKERWNSLVRVYHLDRGGKDENFHKL